MSTLLLACALGCTSDRNWLDVGLPKDYPFRQEHEHITVAVEAWTNPDDQRAAFEKDLASEKVLPLRVVIFNQSEITISFSSTQAKLCLPDHPDMTVLPPSEVSDRAQINETAAAAIILIAVGGYGALVAEAVSQATAKENWEAQGNIRQASLELAKLDPGETLTGFLFYDYELD